MESRSYFPLIDIHTNVNNHRVYFRELEWQRTTNNKLTGVKNSTIYWPKPQTVNRREDVIILSIDYE